MSKIVARMEKMKIGNLGGIQRHNQRETDNHSNKDIDIDRSHLNYDLVNNQPINYREKVLDVIESQRVSTRAVRKDAVLVDEWIITSDKQFFETANSEKFFQDSLDYFSARCGAQNIAYATVHLDETTPHMHLGVVPMQDGKLTSKQVFSRKSLQEIQDQLPNYLKEQGHEIGRGIKGSERKHLTVSEYKENQQAIERMSEEVKQKDNSLSLMDMQLESVKQAFTKDLAEAWEQDWFVTRDEFPLFSMEYEVTISRQGSVVKDLVIVDENTPKEFKLNYREIIDLFKEKFQQVKEYISERVADLREKGSALIDQREKVSDSLAELRNEREINLKANQDMTKAIEAKKEVLERLNSEKPIDVSYLPFVKESRWSKDSYVVPKEEFQEIYKQSVDLKAVKNIEEYVKHVDKTMSNNWAENSNLYHVKLENSKLSLENKLLENQNEVLASGFNELLAEGKLSESEIRELLPENYHAEVGLQPLPKDQSVQQGFEGPELSL